MFLPSVRTLLIVKEYVNTIKLHVFDSGKVVTLSKEVDFIPSNGLMVDEPIKGKICYSYFDKLGYHGEFEHVLNFGEDNNPKAFEHYKKKGFKIVDKQEYEFERMEWNIPDPMIRYQKSICELENSWKT